MKLISIFSLERARRSRRLAALLVAVACASASAATAAEVVVLVRERQPVHSEFVGALRDLLTEDLAKTIRIAGVVDFADRVSGGKLSKRPDLIVAVGTEVSVQVMALKLPVPVLSVAIPRLSFEQLKREHSGRREAGRGGGLSAIFLDQPLERRFELIQQILPRARRVGVVFGPGTLAYAAEFRAAARVRRLILRVGRVEEEGQLIKALDEVLKDSDVLLGVVDPLVFNRASARNILLTAYRWRVPLVGVSQAYVRAGALAAVYTTPGQIARQLAETIAGFRGKGVELPAPQYPKYFSVAVNYQVAESMSISVEEEELLRQRLSSPRSAP